MDIVDNTLSALLSLLIYFSPVAILLLCIFAIAKKKKKATIGLLIILGILLAIPTILTAILVLAYVL